MSLTGKQKKYLKKHLRKKPVDQIASDLKLPLKEIEAYLEKHPKHFRGVIRQLAGYRPVTRLADKAYLGGEWLTQNWKILAFLASLVFIVYLNSLGNDFVSDDISGILQNPRLDEAKYIFTNPFSFFYALIHYLTNKVFGRTPEFFRMFNIVSHLGVTLTIYLLVSLLFNTTTALFSASLFAVHPILTESVTWISGGYYSYSAFLAVLSFLTYLLSSKSQRFKYYYLFSVFLYFLALSTSEKTIAFPIVLIFCELCFGKWRENWKKILPFLGFSLIWAFYLLQSFNTRLSSLATEFYQKPHTINPLYQIPVAITSYLELIFWPKNLTLYHSEMIFSQIEYFWQLGVFLLFLGLIAYCFKKNRQIFFWLSFFIISLLPTLTPFGVSWIVAERYVYPGAIGIFVVIGLLFDKLTQIKKLKPWAIVLFALIIIALSGRTIARNFDWKNQDTLWLATAKTSPSSPQNHNNLGDLYGRRGEYEKAIEEFKKAIELLPNYGDAYHNLANTYHQLGKDDLALENYQKALKFNPNLWQSHQNLAVIYFNQDKRQQAKEELEKAIVIDSQNANLYVNLAIVYRKLGEKEKANQILQQALALDPQNQKAKQLLFLPN